MSAKVESRHVAPGVRGGWSVRKGGASRASRVFGTQEEAIVYARQLARREKAELYIHGRDGTIREKRSYADDPTPSRDKV